MGKLASRAEKQFHTARKNAKSGKCRMALTNFAYGMADLEVARHKGETISAHNNHAADRAEGEVGDHCFSSSVSGLGKLRRRRSRR